MELPMSGLLTANPVYKPFRYPWAYEAWLMQQRLHCLAHLLDEHRSTSYL